MTVEGSVNASDLLLDALDANITPHHVLTFISLIVVSVLVLFVNVLFLLVLNSRSYSLHILVQTRCLVTSLVVNELVEVVLVTLLGSLATLTGFLPYGESFCSIQAIVWGSLGQHRSLIIMMVALERYIDTMYPNMIGAVTAKRISHLSCLTSWLFAFGIYSLTSLPFVIGREIIVNPNGPSYCEATYSFRFIPMIAACIRYFPAALFSLYTFGTIFNIGRRKVKYSRKEVESEKVKRRIIIDRVCVTTLLGLIIADTPRTLKQVIESCLTFQIPLWAESISSWCILIGSFWPALSFYLLDQEFKVALNKKRQKPTNVDCCCETQEGDLPEIPPFPPPRNDPETRRWVEEMERSLSQSSLSGRIYGNGKIAHTTSTELCSVISEGYP